MENTQQDLPLDRGWAWVVLTGSMLEAFLILGILKSFGIYFVEFLIAFNTQAARLSVMLSVQTVFFSAISLLVLTVGEMFDANRVYVMVGGALAGLSFFMSSFATSPEFLIISLGVVYGSAAALSHGPSMVTVQKYFEKRRGAANALMNLGGSGGGIVLPLFIRYLLDTYGLQGSLWIVSGCLINIVVAGAVLRPSNWFRKNSDKSVQMIVQNSDVNNDVNDETNDDDVTQLTAMINKSCNNNIASLGHSQGVLYSVYRKQQLLDSTSNGKPYTRRRTVSDTIVDQKTVTHFRQRSLSTYMNAFGSLASIPLKSKQDAFQDKSEDFNDDSTAFQKMKTLTIKQVFESIFDMNVIRNRLFILHIVASFLSIFGAVLLITYLPPHAKDLGINNNDIALLLTIIGGMDLLNKVLLMLIVDRDYIKIHNLVALTTVIGGISAALVPLCKTFWSLAISSTIYGLFVGTYFTLFTIVLVDFIGLSNVSKGVALTCVTHGISVMIFNPIIGFIRDNLGSYNLAFYLMGGGLFLAGMLFLLEPFVRQLENKRLIKEKQINEIKTDL